MSTFTNFGNCWEQHRKGQVTDVKTIGDDKINLQSVEKKGEGFWGAGGGAGGREKHERV